MRLSLRTLLAFEDNIFGVEQHRRLESLLPTDKDAEATLQRVRSVVRNASLGVPGLVDHQEELDPNYVAEYLDHQMPSSVQEKFENYCLSADKYLAEIASIHHILSNVLGEPAKTSRECRLKCYDLLKKNNAEMETKFANSPALEQLKHFRPDEISHDLVPVKPTTMVHKQPFWKRWFPDKPVPQMPVEQKSVEQKPSLWTFATIGLGICVLLLFWQQQVEKKRVAQQVRDSTETTLKTDSFSAVEKANVHTETLAGIPTQRDNQKSALNTVIPTHAVIHTQTGIQQENVDLFSLDSPICGIDEKNDSTGGIPVLSGVPTQWKEEDPFASIAEDAPPSIVIADNAMAEPMTEPINVDIAEARAKVASKSSGETMIAFQPVTSSAKIPAGVPMRPNPRPALPATVWQSYEETAQNAPSSQAAQTPPSIPLASVQHPAPSPNPLPITQTSGIAPRGLGRALPTTYPSVIFTAASLRAPWQLLPLPLDLVGEQYLLTATPFRGTFELAGCFRIEMIGDTKLCVLPLDSADVPGIFIDYGRIIIHPMQANQSLRIETEKSRNVVTVPSSNSLLFIDTFAEIVDPPSSTKPPEEKKKTSPIIGCIPKNGERIVWRSLNLPQSFVVESQGSILLHADQYRLGEFRKLPNWLEPMPMSPEDRQAAELCQRYFAEARGDAEKALTQMVQDESPVIRTLGLRLWGDLGRFDVPLSVMAAKRPEDEAVHRILGRYINEVMLRDAETVQRLADAIEIVKEAQ